MSCFVIQGGRKLYGEVNIQRSKNAVLPMLAGTLLTNERVTLYDCPTISDVFTMRSILSGFSQCSFSDGTIFVEGERKNAPLSALLCKKLRASSVFLGACLAVFGEVVLPLPGGCAIGKRPINMHLNAFRSLGVEIEEGNEEIRCSIKNRRGGKIALPYPSVGATENLLLYAVLAEGETILRGVAKEPEIVDFARFLKSMGARIKGEGESEIVVEGVSSLHGTNYTPMYDRIECGTFLIACACTGGEIEVLGNGLQKNDPLITKLSQNGCKITFGNDKINIISRTKRAFALQTGPYPAFATDLQPMMGTLACLSTGESSLTETVFEDRFSYLSELEKMGARIRRENGVMKIEGTSLHSATIEAKDLRGGASLLLAGLSAEGETKLLHSEYIDRGYACPEKKFSLLGAGIERIIHE